MKIYKYIIIGAGPSGIIVVDKLLSYYSLSPDEILWVDPYFKVGDFGVKWRNVPSNTRVKDFIKFFEACNLYNEDFFRNTFSLFTLNPYDTCYLKYAIEPLQWMSDTLINKVSSINTFVQSIEKIEDEWKITLSNNEERLAKNIILTQGADPIKLPYSHCTEIPLETALNKDKLIGYCDKHDRIAVFGSSHSAILVLKNLFEIKKCQKILNFYRSPIRYATYLDNDQILFDNTGLKGTAALFARQHIETYRGSQLLRIKSTEENINKYLPQCTKLIYAIGFHPRKINTSGFDISKYDKSTGIISKGLYGLGFAYPSEITNHIDETEKNIGLLKFARHLENIFPLWEEDFR